MLYVVFALTSFGAIFDNRWFVEIIEIQRCLLYFAFDRYLITGVQWPIGPNLYLILEIFLWIIRSAHILSILFWFGHYLIRIHIQGEALRNVVRSKIGKQLNTINNSKNEAMPDLEHRSAKTSLRTSTVLLITTLVTVSVIIYTFIYFFKVQSCSTLLEA